MIAVQIPHISENCAITTLWHNPDNLAEAPLSNYTFAIDGVPNTIEANKLERSSSDIFFTSCGRHLVTLRAVNICGHESPLVRITLTENDCLIKQDSICFGDVVPTAIPNTTDGGNAANKLQGE